VTFKYLEPDRREQPGQGEQEHGEEEEEGDEVATACLQRNNQPKKPDNSFPDSTPSNNCFANPHARGGKVKAVTSHLWDKIQHCQTNTLLNYPSF